MTITVALCDNKASFINHVNSMLSAELIVTLATITEAVVLAPILFEFLIDRRKRAHAVELSLEIIDVSKVKVDLAGMDDLLADIRDLIDRARHPEAYKTLRFANEILIAGPALSGKKALAKRIAKEANFDRIIVVYNPNNVDALARARHLLLRARKKVMLLLPRLDLINECEDDALLSELDALIESAAGLSHALVIGTTNRMIVGGEVDYLFGMTLSLPGATIVSQPTPPLEPEVHRMLAAVADFYLDRMLTAGYQLKDISRDGFIARILVSVKNAGEIEDAVTMCQAMAIYRQRMKETGKERLVTPEILELSLRRVVAGS